jgi:hypothetical protein
MPSSVHRRNLIRGDLAFCQQHLQHVTAEYILQGFGFCISGGGNGKQAAFMKTAVGNGNVQVRGKKAHPFKGGSREKTPPLGKKSVNGVKSGIVN